ncbi:MAG TPA: hypothetical protein VFP47_05630, partial [Pyrinomonadaceae bacterium]|nr:hypothetical protein [Pyrinomonadaceae bacterium]
ALLASGARSQVRPLPRVPSMTTHPRDVVAVLHQCLGLDEAALKQVSVLFNRLAFPGLSALKTLPNTHQSMFPEHLRWLAEKEILFEPDTRRSDDPDFKNRLLKDIDELYKPVGLSAEDLLAARKDKEKATEFKQKASEMGPALMSGSFDPSDIVKAIQRMTVNVTRLQAIQLRNLDNLDAHAIVPSEFSSFHQDDDSINKHEVVRVVVSALPVPDEQVSWQKIIEYRSDPNSLNRFLDLRNWIGDTASGKLTPLEVEEKLEPVLKRFRKQMEFHRMATVTTTFEAFVVTTTDVIRSLFGYGGRTSPKGLCSLEHLKIALLEGESTAKGSVVAYVLKTRSLMGL